MKANLTQLITVGSKNSIWLGGDFSEIYDILNFMTGDSLFTHQLPRALRECRPYLQTQFKWVKNVLNLYDKVTPENADEIRLALIELFGNEFEVQPIPKDAHVVKNPLGELLDMIDKKET